jgi:hypothetical protein
MLSRASMRRLAAIPLAGSCTASAPGTRAALEQKQDPGGTKKNYGGAT